MQYLTVDGGRRLGRSPVVGAAKFSGAFDAGVSANLIGNTVSTNVKGLSQLDGAAFNTAYNQASWVGDNQVTGGIGFSFGKGGNTGAKSFGGSLIFALLILITRFLPNLQTAI